jgi:hypothetical protein
MSLQRVARAPARLHPALAADPEMAFQTGCVRPTIPAGTTWRFRRLGRSVANGKIHVAKMPVGRPG